MIPLQFHRIWVGGKEIPAEYLHWIEDCRRLHPNWRQRLWRDADLERLIPAVLRDCWARANPVQKSDIGGYVLVHEHGGVYCDLDYRWYQPIDPYLYGCDAFAVHTDGGKLSGSVFGAIRHHRAFLRLLNAIPERFREVIPGRTGPAEQLSTSSTLLTEILLGDPMVRKLERRTFIPIPFAQRGKLRSVVEFPWSVAVHQFAGSWLG